MSCELTAHGSWAQARSPPGAANRVPEGIVLLAGGLRRVRSTRCARKLPKEGRASPGPVVRPSVSVSDGPDPVVPSPSTGASTGGRARDIGCDQRPRNRPTGVESPAGASSGSVQPADLRTAAHPKVRPLSAVLPRGEPCPASAGPLFNVRRDASTRKVSRTRRPRPCARYIARVAARRARPLVPRRTTSSSDATVTIPFRSRP